MINYTIVCMLISCLFLGHMQPNEVTKPYFDDDNISSSEDASDLEFIRPGREWEEETNKEHR